MDSSLQIDRSQEIMLWIHPYILLISTFILSFGGLYAGCLHPFIFHCFHKNKRISYIHQSTLFTQILSLLTGIITSLMLLYVAFGGFYNSSLVVSNVWNQVDYWKSNEKFIMPGYIFWYIYGSYIFNLILNITFALFARWEPTISDKEEIQIKKISERHAFIIVAHNSSRKLAKPIEAIMKFASPHQIFVADNGSSAVEIDKTKQLCSSFDQGNSKIQLGHLHYGNKTLAQYSCVLELIRRYEENSRNSPDIITIIDDDVFIPESFPSTSIEDKFNSNPETIAIAYPLRIANPKTLVFTPEEVIETDNSDNGIIQQQRSSFLSFSSITSIPSITSSTTPLTSKRKHYTGSVYASLQDGEYLSGNVARCIQNLLGTQLFASGAIATFRLYQLKYVLERHCTAFNGEDLEFGCLIHKLCDIETTKLGMNCPVRIGYQSNCVVPTTVPVHFIHWYDVLPNPVKRYFGILPCSCEEHSFFNQRVRSWDPACHAFFFKFLKVIFSPRGFTCRKNYFARIICFWKIISMLRDYFFIFGIVFSFSRLRNVFQLVDLFIFYSDCIFVSWAFGVIRAFSQSLAHKGLSMPPDTLFVYPLLLELPYSIIIQPISVMYSILYYVFFQRSPKPIKEQLKDDIEKQEAVLNVWK